MTTNPQPYKMDWYGKKQADADLRAINNEKLQPEARQAARVRLAIYYNRVKH